jgi:16S rRNA (guanine966-N2)-methyltransferase
VIRVTGGAFRGRNLRVPAEGVRPTPSMVRGAVFSILGGLGPDDPGDGRVMLDLFAGSGVMTVEALGRGFARAVCVEKARPVFALLRRNLEDLGLVDRVRCVAGDALRFLRDDGGIYDLIYMDPPFALTQLRDEVLEAAGARPRLTPDGVLLLEQDARHEPPPAAGRLARFMTRRWGQTQVSFYHDSENSRLPRIV